MIFALVFTSMLAMGAAEVSVDDSFSNELFEFEAATLLGTAAGVAVGASPAGIAVIALGAGIGEQYLEEAVGY